VGLYLCKVGIIANLCQEVGVGKTHLFGLWIRAEQTHVSAPPSRHFMKAPHRLVSSLRCICNATKRTLLEPWQKTQRSASGRR